MTIEYAYNTYYTHQSGCNKVKCTVTLEYSENSLVSLFISPFNHNNIFYLKFIQLYNIFMVDLSGGCGVVGKRVWR